MTSGRRIAVAEASSAPTSWKELLAATAAYLILTVALTWPQARLLTTHIGWHYDSMFSLWRLGWIAHQLPRDPLSLFDGNIFYPEPRTLTFSDATLFQGVAAAPLVWIGIDLVVVYNLIVLGSFVLSGLAMFVLVRSLIDAPPGQEMTSSLAAFVAGVVFAFQPYRIAHYPQLELLCGWWIPAALSLFHRVADRRRVRDGVLLGVIVALQVWSCIYYSIYLGTALSLFVAVAVVLQRHNNPRALLLPLVATLVVAAALSVPYLLPYMATRSMVGTRSEGDVLEWSPTVWNYLASMRESWFYGRTTGYLGHVESTLFPGIAAILLAPLGLLRPFTRRSFVYLILLLGAFDLSLGSNGVMYPLFYKWVPAYQAMRVPGRMFVIVSAALAVLAGFGTASVLRRLGHRWLRTAAGVGIAALVALENISIPIPLAQVPKPPEFYRWLATEPHTVVMEWPVPNPSNLGFTKEPLFMFYSTAHWQSLVNGYSGFYPPSYLQLLEYLRKFPNDDTMRRLRQRGVQYVIIHRELVPEEDYDRLVQALALRSDVAWMRSERHATGSLDVYRLR